MTIHTGSDHEFRGIPSIIVLAGHFPPLHRKVIRAMIYDSVHASGVFEYQLLITRRYLPVRGKNSFLLREWGAFSVCKVKDLLLRFQFDCVRRRFPL